MKTQNDILKLLKRGKLESELDLERALLADRKLRVLSKEDAKYIAIRKQLRELITEYENKHWSSDSKITDEQMAESDLAERLIEAERRFFHRRRDLIREKLKSINLTQQDLGEILGHSSKSYMSELMNGVSPFTLKDLVLINSLLKIDFTDLVPAFIPQSEKLKIQASIQKLENSKIRLNKADFSLV